jgi:hypothetical protein
VNFNENICLGTATARSELSYSPGSLLSVFVFCCSLLKNAVRHRFLPVVLESAARLVATVPDARAGPFFWSVFPPACAAEANSMVWSARAEVSPKVPVCSSVRFCGPCL